jgi:hypothetical protein
MNEMVQELASSLRRFDGSMIEEAAERISADGDELAPLRATLAIDRALRGHGRSVEAAAAGRIAADAVTAAALAAGLSADDPNAVAVARRAADVARGLVVAGSVLPHLAVLLRRWSGPVAFHPGDDVSVTVARWRPAGSG